MRGSLKVETDRQTDRQTYRQTYRQKEREERVLKLCEIVFGIGEERGAE